MRTAAYCRYSTDQQSAASLEDQARNCRTYCERMGWPEPMIYSDAAVSGSRNDRPGYQRLLADAEQFAVIVVDDLARLSRDSVEVAIALRRLSFRGIRVIAASDGIDTTSKGSKANIALRGLMGELYLDDLRDKTHRGLTGRALAGASAGGLPYGYRVTTTGQRSIDEAQAEVVRRIYADYLAGKSPRQIAHALNAEGVPTARGKTWAMSAIHGDGKRGIGILANPIYTGRQIWNRSRWVKHPDTGRRVRQERPQAEWITTEHPELAVVDTATFDAVQRRLRGNSRSGGVRGRPARHLLSGLLRCDDCDGPLVVVDAYNYGCARAKDRGTCPSRVRVNRKVAEERMVAGVRETVLGPEAFADFQRHAAAALRRQGSERDAGKRKLAEALRWRDNVLRAIREGIVSASVKADLMAAEAAVEAAERESAAPVARMLPNATTHWERLRASLADVRRARDTLRELIGSATVRNENGEPVAEFAVSQIALVAGAGFGPYLRGPRHVLLAKSRE